MKLINTDGMAFIGPGSEWFWTALSGFILAVTFLAIYRQLRLQANQGAIEQVGAFRREWQSERFISYRLDIYLQLRAGVDAAHLPDAAAAPLAQYWEEIATLVRRRHLDRKLLWDADSSTCQAWWAVLGPYGLRERTETEDPSAWENFEWLAGVMHELDRRSGRGTTFPGPDTAMLDHAIAASRERIRVERSLRTMIVASPDAMTGGQPAVAEG